MPTWAPTVLAFAAILGAAGTARAQTEDECIASNEAAVTLRKSAKLLDARKALTVCAAPVCPEVIRASCTQRLEEVNTAIPGIVLRATDGHGNDLFEVRVQIDGVPYADRLNGTVIRLDPGPHAFTLERTGVPQVTKQWVLQEGDQDRTETVVLQAPAPPAPTAPVGMPVERISPGRMENSTSSEGSGLRTWGVALGIVGLVGIAAGVVGGVAAKNYYETAAVPQGSDPECSVGGYCTSDGTYREKTAHSWADISTGVFIGGAALTAAGIGLFIGGAAAGGHPKSALVLVPSPGGALLRGSW